MSSLSDSEKLRMRLSYWIEHNIEHSDEFREWADRAESLGSEKAASKLQGAAMDMLLVNRSLEAALDSLGGPVKRPEQ